MMLLSRLRFIALLAATAVCGRAASFSPADFGAHFDPLVNDAGPLQKAIDAAAAAGGGTVVIPSGKTLMSGSFAIKSGVTLMLEAGSRILGSTHRADYVNSVFIYALDAEDIAIAGQGTIDGQGLSFLGKEDTYIYERTADDWRPRMILFEHCKRVKVSQVNLINSGFWTLHLAGCEDCSITEISIRNSLKAPNCDGIDPDDSRNVRITNCSIDCGDDAIVVKASQEYAKYGPCENIVVTGCVLMTHDCALKIGSETAMPIRNIIFGDCVIRKCGRGIGIVLRDSGDVENLIAHDITMHSELFYPEWWGSSEPIYINAHPRTPGGKMGKLKGIYLSHIISDSEGGVFLQGSAECVPEDVVLDDVQMTIHKTSQWPSRIDLRPPEELGVSEKNVKIAGFHLQDVKDVTLRNCSLHWGPAMSESYGQAIVSERAPGLKVEGFDGTDAHK